MKKENKKRWIKSVCASLALAMGMSVVTPSIGVYAVEKEQMQTSEKEEVGYQPSYDELKELGLTDEEINELKNIKDTGITLENGVAYKDGKVLKDGNSMQRGRMSWAVKALRAVWKKIPKKVKKTLGGVAGFETLLGYIDHFTGSVESNMQKGLRKMGFGKTTAWWITKILTAIAF
ncbi:Uncharacterised protein [Listeria grayi]|uniref:Uncharacterized protein n=1 Tax=Listeria grayi FSL F6-1183 TaxID=1265827 RepID=A0A829R9X6_LISGR|nr:hypothetical protein [Listeria grayi]EUJ30125.1 hypothetical protein LMUR_03592 [Listeria grayi FSL F6-1183]VEI33741.1 Uncharacterised protein [Listeria grayi]